MPVLLCEVCVVICRVTGMCGDMEMSVCWLIENHDIVVMTAQILVNALQSGEVPSLEMLSLILFDECHNTTGKHPYNNIMTRYLDTKLTSSTHSLPQVHSTPLYSTILYSPCIQPTVYPI